MAHNVFTYGTLMCAEVMRSACGALPTASPARLDGFSRHPVAGEDYPGIRPQTDAQVEGLLYLDLTPTQFAQLDRFEGAQYVRQPVTVTLPDGRRLSAHTYVFAEAFRHLLLPGEWDYAGFEATARERFRARYPGFHHG